MARNMSLGLISDQDSSMNFIVSMMISCPHIADYVEQGAMCIAFDNQATVSSSSSISRSPIHQSSFVGNLHEPVA